MAPAPGSLPDRPDVAVVGGGIVGLATALALAGRGRRVTVLEAEAEVGRHQTGRNSGVLHAGLYYAPGSWKARLCAEGRERMWAFAGEEGVPRERCGKLVVATAEAELGPLAALERRARENGLDGVRRLGPAEIRAREPEARGLAALLVPETGIVDFAAAARAMARRLEAAGHAVVRGFRVRRIETGGGEDVVMRGARGETLRAGHLVNCGGLQSDRLARAAGARPEARIVPFRGDYFQLRRERRGLVRHLIYPVPDPRFPFLGVHFTRRVDGSVEAGPNAVLAFDRHGYRRGAFAPRDAASTLGYPGFWRFLARHLRPAWREWRRAGSVARFAADLERLVPAVRAADLEPGGCGIRAQALDRSGRLVDDFLVLRAARSTHVLNAPSPAATASLAIGRHVADLVERG